MRDFKDFLNKGFVKEDLQYVLGHFRGIKTSGTKGQLVDRILNSSLAGLEHVLFRNCNKAELKRFAERLKTRPTGTKDEILNRIVKALELERLYPSEHENFEFDRDGYLVLFTVDLRYILDQYFTIPWLKEMCDQCAVEVSGTKPVLIDRLIEVCEIRPRTVIEYLDVDQLESLIEMMDVDAHESSREENINRIVTKLLFEKASGSEKMDSSAPKSEAPEYDIALSFAGEDREVAENLAEALRRLEITVFYDDYNKAELWGKDLYEHLSHIYGKACRFCILIISRHYAEKAWTNHERQQAQARAFKERNEYILPVRLDATEIPGIASTIGYVDYPQTSIFGIAELAKEKLRKIL